MLGRVRSNTPETSDSLFGMALLTTLLTPGLHISELAVRRPLLRSRSHAVCKIDVATANAFSCMGFNIGRQVPCQASWRAALQPDRVPLLTLTPVLTSWASSTCSRRRRSTLSSQAPKQLGGKPPPRGPGQASALQP